MNFAQQFEYLKPAQGDPTYLIVEADRTLATYGINAVCTHLGCVVPWNKAENKFICPCHGSQYNNQGKVVRGPAPLVSVSFSSFLLYVDRKWRFSYSYIGLVWHHMTLRIFPTSQRLVITLMLLVHTLYIQDVNTTVKSYDSSYFYKINSTQS